MDYLHYWGLEKKPFENTGDTRFFYYSPGHKEALVRLIYVIKQNKAGALLAGDYGTGKTTIANELIAEIEESDEYRSVYLSNPLLTSRELLKEITYKLGLSPGRSSRPDLRRCIEKEFKKAVSEGSQVVVIVDEAHLITRKDTLEELRLMMNLQERNRFLTTIIMMGQLELRDVINAMPQFKQRFAMCYLLEHLNDEETRGYMDHRLRISGAKKPLFENEAVNAVYRASSGRPRQINNICDMSLLVGYMRKKDTVGTDVIEEVCSDMGEKV